MKRFNISQIDSTMTFVENQHHIFILDAIYYLSVNNVDFKLTSSTE